MILNYTKNDGGEAKMKTITLRMEDNVKEALDEMLESMGMNISTFYNIYTLRALRERKIPFDITAPADPYFSEPKVDQIKKFQNMALNAKIKNAENAAEKNVEKNAEQAPKVTW